MKQFTILCGSLTDIPATTKHVDLIITLADTSFVIQFSPLL